MSNIKSKASHRLLAVFLSFVMVFSMIPFSTMGAYAATATHPDAVTVTVVDDVTGEPIEGAKVTYTIYDNDSGENVMGDNDVPTDANGEVVIFDGSEPGNIKVSSITITHDDYSTYTNDAYDKAITSLDDNFIIEMACTKIKDVKISGKTLTYTGDAQELVSVTKVEGDTVEYYLNGATDSVTEVPTATDAATYSVRVVVTREGKTPLDQTVETVINPADIEGIDIAPVTGLKYNEADQALVTLTGNFDEHDTVTWSVNGTDETSTTVPHRMAVGSYSVKLTVDRGANYNKFEKTVNVDIALGEINLGDLQIEAVNRTYDTTEKELLSVTKGGDYTLEYSDDNQVTWVKNDIPKATNAGEYIIYVKATKDGYTDKNTPAFPITVTIAKAEQSFDFDKYDAMADDTNPETIELKGAVPYGKTYDFSATDVAALANGIITYEVVANEDAAEIAADGTLTVNHPGAITVIAKLSGNDNYKECIIKYYLDVTGAVSSNGQYIEFAVAEKNFVIGTSSTISEQRATKKDRWITGDITYSINDVKGVAINPASGKLTVTDIDKLVEEVRDGHNEIVVTAKKAATRRYGADEISYKVIVSFEATPSNPYSLSDVDGTNDWYKTEAIVTPVDGYAIAQKASDSFETTTEFSNQGTDVRYVYLKNTATGGITDRIAVNIKIDKTAPIVRIKHDSDGQKTIFTVVEHNFRASDVVISGTMKDIKGADVAFTAAQLTDILNDATWTQNGDVYTYEYNQYVNGIYNLKMDYTDIAGWPATEDVKEKEVEFIIDHDKPTEPTIEYITTPTTPWETFLNVITFGYYNPSVTVRFTSYDASAGVKSFTWGYTKEAGASIINHPETLPETLVDATVPAVQDQNDKSKFTAEITLTAEDAAQYRGYLSVLSTDAFQNSSDKKVDNRKIIVVDTIAPTLNVEYNEADRYIPGEGYFYNKSVDVKLTVTEANFYPEDVVVSVTKNGIAFDYGTITWGSRDAEDKTIGTFTLPAPADHTGDGHYVITVEYTDRSNNKMVKHVSDTHTIDTTLPIINVEYKNKTVINKLTDPDGKERAYYADKQTAVVTITEHNFIEEEVGFDIVAKDVTGAELAADKLNSKTVWDTNGDVHTITIEYPGDANYTFGVKYTDKATNKADYDRIDYFTVDKTAPTNLKVEYSTSVLDTVLESLSFGFYNAKMTVTLTAEDTTSEVHSFLYSYLNAAGVSSVNAVLINEAIGAADIKYSTDRKTATVTFEIPKMVLGNDNQFNGTVEFTATDRAGNTTDTHKETKRIVVDNIAPTAQVSYNEATNVVGDISYYNGDITATVTINEANFYAGDVQVMVSRDGGAATAITPTWTDNSVDVHVGTFTITGDGDYVVTIKYSDKSSNKMATYTSKQMTVDTKIEAPTYTINGVAKNEVGGAYKGDAAIGFNFNDQNFDTKTITLTRTRFDKVEDVTETFIKVNDNDKGGSGSFTIPTEVGNDGIYVLKITMTDKAKHETESEIKFTINRYGSVYEYSEDLVELIKDGGQYVQSVGSDLVITEYNADKLLAGSLNILVTRDGENVDVDYTSDPAVNEAAGIGQSGWYQYTYTIKAANFAQDGVYKISLTSKYATDDSAENESTSVPNNSIDSTGKEIIDTMNFTVDSVAPEIRNIVNLNKAIADKDKIVDGKLNVKYTIVDVGGLKSIEIIVNGKTLQTLTKEDLADSLYNFTGNFDLEEQSGTIAHTVQIIVTDLAGNVTDTNSNDFLKEHSADNENSTYVFFNKVTVSRNFFVRWYANTALFWGSIGGVIVLAAAIWFLVTSKRKKNKEK